MVLSLGGHNPIAGTGIRPITEGEWADQTTCADALNDAARNLRTALGTDTGHHHATELLEMQARLYELGADIEEQTEAKVR